MAIPSAVLAPGCRAGADGDGLLSRMPRGKVVLATPAPPAAAGSLAKLSLGLSCLGGSGHGTGAAPSAGGPEPDGAGPAQPGNGGRRGTAAAAVRRGRSWRDARRAGVGRRSKLAARTGGASELALRSCRLAYRTGGGSKLAWRSGGAAPANAERGGRAAAGGAGGGGGGASHAGLLGCCIAELLAALWLVAARPLAPDWPPAAGSLLPKLAFIGASGAAGSASRGAGEPLAAGAPAVQAGAAGAAAAEGGWLPCCPWFACKDAAMGVSPPLSGGVAATAGAAAPGAAGGPTVARALRKPAGKRPGLFTCDAQRWERYRGRSEMAAALALRRCTMPAVLLQSTKCGC